MLRAIAAFVGIVACVGCDLVGANDDPRATRDRLESSLCSSRTLDQVVDALKAESIEYFLDREHKILTAKRPFQEDKLISSTVVIEIGFNADQSISQCRVRVLHTGP